mmetsp:Transcript_5654/g.8208  ORF Transcript_5654/g.8208 Transcript_5654/m.8208 type:complete len:85 (+) Transcript_5654:413-667(+)
MKTQESGSKLISEHKLRKNFSTWWQMVISELLTSRKNQKNIIQKKELGLVGNIFWPMRRNDFPLEVLDMKDTMFRNSLSTQIIK